MNKRTIWFIIISMGVALLGSILLQMYWIRLTFREQENQFDREVNRALLRVVDTIEKREITQIDASVEHMTSFESLKLVDEIVKKNIFERLGNIRGILFIDSLLKKEVQMLGDRQEYHYGIFSDHDSGFVVIDNKFTVSIMTKNLSNSGLKKGLYNTPYTERVFKHGDPGAGRLFLYLPYRKEIIWKSLIPAAVGSILFTALILACFAYTIYIIQRQKKISDMKNDFINNMTHEFKTPIATISLASDSINNPSIISNPEKVQRFTKIIRQENTRMLGQVEKVLQLAQLEKKDLQLKISDININELLLSIAEHVNLQIKSKKGKLQLNLEATDPIIEGDMTHISNILYNLLDNANKYTPDTPVIKVTTRNIQQGIEINIEDNGIGISRENQKNIFEKFYRVSTGNLHDVKGFGLGLSYVKVMVGAHQGQVQVKSALGKGSTFQLYFPKKQNKQKMHM
ncbi:MAG: HAMP domain-containing sensor histidine kinase [Saprospiraceae bacterium]